jgi:hypothetical protein
MKLCGAPFFYKPGDRPAQFILQAAGAFLPLCFILQRALSLW